MAHSAFTQCLLGRQKLLGSTDGNAAFSLSGLKLLISTQGLNTSSATILCFHVWVQVCHSYHNIMNLHRWSAEVSWCRSLLKGVWRGSRRSSALITPPSDSQMKISGTSSAAHSSPLPLLASQDDSCHFQPWNLLLLRDISLPGGAK